MRPNLAFLVRVRGAESESRRRGAWGGQRPVQHTDVSKSESNTVKTEAKVSDKDEAPVFMVQILTSSKKLPSGSSQFKGQKNVEYYFEKGLYKYYCCKSADYNYVYKKRRELAEKFKGAFIIAFKNGKRVDVNDAIDEYKKTKR